MKYIYTFFLVLAISFSLLRAKVPNEGFENWTSGEPDFWTTNNSDPYFTVTHSNSSHSGSFALKGECIQILNPVCGINVTLSSEIYLDDLELSMDMVSDLEDEFQPLVFQLEQNYPNPFKPFTKIQYQVSSNSHVTLKVYDVLGNEVTTLVDEEKPAGNYKLDFNASSLSSGVYLYKIQAGSFIESKKVILLR